MTHMYQPGDRVIMRKEFKGAPLGVTAEMERRRGTIMTIREIQHGFVPPAYYMVEDQNEYSGNIKPGWLWSEAWIADYADQPDVQELEMLL